MISVSLFTSDRERHLWLWTLAVLLAIYATLGSSRRLAEGLREHNQLRPAITVTAVYLFTIFRMQIPEERAHLIEYGLVAILIRQALAERRRNGGLA